MGETRGFFNSANYPNDYSVGTVQQWKVHCYNDYTAIIIDNMDLSEGDYLQVREERYSGKLTRPKSRVIQKSSVGVIFSGKNGNSTGFNCAFLCIGECNVISIH